MIDPYIINNMPEDDGPIADIDLAFGLDDGSEVALSFDGNSYVLTIAEVDPNRQVGDLVESKLVAAFDPILNLAQCMAILRVIHAGELTGASDEAAAVIGNGEAEADQG